MGRMMCALVVVVLLCSCGGGTSEAIRRGVGAECNANLVCAEADQQCLTQFKGGYCGRMGCLHDTDCPGGSACVTEDNGMNYCFLVCVDKPDCNINRSLENEASCVSSLTFIDGANGRKVCRPSMGGTNLDASVD